MNFDIVNAACSMVLYGPCFATMSKIPGRKTRLIPTGYRHSVFSHHIVLACPKQNIAKTVPVSKLRSLGLLPSFQYFIPLNPSEEDPERLSSPDMTDDARSLV